MCAFYSIQLSHLFSRAIKPSHLSAMPCLVIRSSEEGAQSSPEVLSKYIGHVLYLLFTQFVWKQMKWPREVQEPWSGKQGVHPFALSKALKGFWLHRWLIQQKGQWCINWSKRKPGRMVDCNPKVQNWPGVEQSMKETHFLSLAQYSPSSKKN